MDRRAPEEDALQLEDLPFKLASEHKVRQAGMGSLHRPQPRSSDLWLCQATLIQGLLAIYPLHSESFFPLQSCCQLGVKSPKLMSKDIGFKIRR